MGSVGSLAKATPNSQIDKLLPAPQPHMRGSQETSHVQQSRYFPQNKDGRAVWK